MSWRPYDRRQAAVTRERTDKPLVVGDWVQLTLEFRRVHRVPDARGCIEAIRGEGIAHVRFPVPDWPFPIYLLIPLDSLVRAPAPRREKLSAPLHEGA
mgnify:CR=1 FL=1